MQGQGESRSGETSPWKPAVVEQELFALDSVPAIFGVGNAGSLAVAVTFLVLFGLGWGFFDCNNMPILCQVARPELRLDNGEVVTLTTRTVAFPSIQFSKDPGATYFTVTYSPTLTELRRTVDGSIVTPTGKIDRAGLRALRPGRIYLAAPGPG